MNTYVTLVCVLAVLGLSQGSAVGAYGYGLGYGHGYGYGIVAPAAISHANVVKAAPIPVYRAVAPIVTAPVLRTVAAPIAVGYGGYGLGHGYGLGYGGYGHGWGLGYGGYGHGWGLGYGGQGLGAGYGYGLGHGYGYGIGRHHG